MFFLIFHRTHHRQRTPKKLPKFKPKVLSCEITRSQISSLRSNLSDQINATPRLKKLKAAIVWPNSSVNLNTWPAATGSQICLGRNLGRKIKRLLILDHFPVGLVIKIAQAVRWLCNEKR